MRNGREGRGPAFEGRAEAVERGPPCPLGSSPPIGRDGGEPRVGGVLRQRRAVATVRACNATQGPHAPPLPLDPTPVTGQAAALLTRAAEASLCKQRFQLSTGSSRLG